MDGEKLPVGGPLCRLLLWSERSKRLCLGLCGGKDDEILATLLMRLLRDVNDMGGWIIGWVLFVISMYVFRMNDEINTRTYLLAF